MALKLYTILSALILSSWAQRPFYSGLKPIGYPVLERKTTTPSPNSLGNRFGESDTTSTTMRLPVEVLGSQSLYDQLSKLPIDQQPFWFINWKAEEERRKHPQTYPQRPPGFVDHIALGLDFTKWY